MTQSNAVTKFSAVHRYREATAPIAHELGRVILHLASVTPHQPEDKKPAYKAARLFLVAARNDIGTATDLHHLDGQLSTTLREISKVEPAIETTYAPSLLIHVARNILKAV